MPLAKGVGPLGLREPDKRLGVAFILRDLVSVFHGRTPNKFILISPLSVSCLENTVAFSLPLLLCVCVDGWMDAFSLSR